MKRRVVLLLVLSLVIATVGIGSTKSSDAADRDELLRLDREFDRKVADGGGGAAWASYFAENGSMVGQAGAPVVGPEAIRARMEPVFANPDFSLRWQPARAEILIPGHVGYTTGRYERRVKHKEGNTEVEHGTYVSVWRKQADGSWKIILDTGNADPAPAAK